MTINDYQKEALRTVNQYAGLIENAALGLCGESGEVADMVKKAFFQGHELDRIRFAKELGDVAWYLAVGAFAIGYELETVLQMNVDKLRKRYPDGFDPTRSRNRKEDDV